MSWPEKIKHNTTDEPVIALDVLPTVCDILNIDLPNDLSKQHPEIRNHLINKYQEWRAEMGEPMMRDN